MKTPMPAYNNIDFSKVEDKHIYAVLGVGWIVIGLVMIWLLIISSK